VQGHSEKKPVDLRLTAVKSLGTKWLKGLYGYLKGKPEIISNSFKEAGITTCLDGRIVRADHGTENAIVAEMPIVFRLNHTDALAGPKSFIYGPSTANIVSCTNCIGKRVCYIVTSTWFLVKEVHQLVFLLHFV